MILSGCGLTESSELMSGARKFIEKGEYDKAMTNLSKVLDEDESNSEARGMYYQALKLKKAQIYADRKNYDQEIKELQELLNDNSGSSRVRGQAEEMLQNAQELQKNQNRAEITRKENAKKSAEENKDKYKTTDVYRSNYGYNNYSRYRKKKYGTQSNSYSGQANQSTASGTNNNDSDISQDGSQSTGGYGQNNTYKYKRKIRKYNQQ